MKKGQIFECEVTDIAFGGKGIAKIDGMAVFIDGAVPGDRVSARIIRKKKNFAEARVLDILAPSEFRIDPPCRYSSWCGGCKWQFLLYDKQLEYKRRHVIESLEHIGKLPGVPVLPAVPSDRRFGYRNKMEFTCTDRRWLLPEELGNPEIDAGFAIGLHVPGTFHKVLDTEICLIQPEQGNHILEEVRKYIRDSKLPPYGLRSHQGFWRFVMLRHSVAFDRWMVNIVTASENRSVVAPLAETLGKKFPEIVSVVNNITSRKAGVAFGEYEIPLYGDSVLKEKIGPFTFEISANSFFQTNTTGAERLYGITGDYAELSPKSHILDLYCGTGAIGIFLSENAASVTGLEISESAVADARKNSRINGIENCNFIAGDIRERLADIESVPDVMVIDPPRDGMHKDVVREVLHMAPEKIVYVSCNPATLARDLFSLKDAYEITEVTPVDMFPHTWHIESVARLVRR